LAVIAANLIAALRQEVRLVMCFFTASLLRFHALTQGGRTR
jgi:hypothetical protein